MDLLPVNFSLVSLLGPFIVVLSSHGVHRDDHVDHLCGDVHALLFNLKLQLDEALFKSLGKLFDLGRPLKFLSGDAHIGLLFCKGPGQSGVGKSAPSADLSWLS